MRTQSTPRLANRLIAPALRAVLVLVLALANIGTGMARGGVVHDHASADPLVAVVLCAGAQGEVTLWLDDRGEPADPAAVVADPAQNRDCPAGHCPACLSAGVFALPGAAAAATRARSRADARLAALPRHRRGRRQNRQGARNPPQGKRN